VVSDQANGRGSGFSWGFGRHPTSATIVAVELHLRDTSVPDRLNGCGLAVISPPYGFESEARVISDAVLEGLGTPKLGRELR